VLSFYLWYKVLFHCAATLRVAGSLQKSTEVMQAMQSLVRIPEVAATMRDLSKEMMRVKLNIFSGNFTR
jgi:division protein CdvB (Snf7/Vps24/ESCRT-III family)